MAHSLLRLPAVKARTGLSRSSIYVKIARGTFPAPIQLGDPDLDRRSLPKNQNDSAEQRGGPPRAVAWVESEILEWIDQRISASRMAAQGDAA